MIKWATVTAALIILVLVADHGPGAQQAEPPPILTTCLLLNKGIGSKEAALMAWNFMLLQHVAKTADNVVAFPGTEKDQLDTFERGLRRARKVDDQIRAIIERVYKEP